MTESQFIQGSVQTGFAVITSDSMSSSTFFSLSKFNIDVVLELVMWYGLIFFYNY